MLRFLTFCSKFHRYSIYNQLLILLQFPSATQVAGYHAWNSFDRFVRKGEHGIPILAPIFIKEPGVEKKEEKMMILRGFKVCFVFDVSQTDGEPLPEPPDWKKDENNVILNERLLQFAKEHNIQVSVKELNGPQGISHGGSIEIDPTAGSSTRIHELAHELMKHHGSELPTSIKELEAEATAFVVCRHFGLQSACSPNYLALHHATAERHHERFGTHSSRFDGDHSICRTIAGCVFSYSETGSRSTGGGLVPSP